MWILGTRRYTQDNKSTTTNGHGSMLLQPERADEYVLWGCRWVTEVQLVIVRSRWWTEEEGDSFGSGIVCEMAARLKLIGGEGGKVCINSVTTVWNHNNEPHICYCFHIHPRMHEPLWLGHRPLIIHDPTQIDMILGLSLLVREFMNRIPWLGGVMLKHKIGPLWWGQVHVDRRCGGRGCMRRCELLWLPYWCGYASHKTVIYTASLARTQNRDTGIKYSDPSKYMYINPAKISLGVDTWHEGDVHEITKAPLQGHQKQANGHNEHECMRSSQLPAFLREWISMFLLENAGRLQTHQLHYYLWEVYLVAE